MEKKEMIKKLMEKVNVSENEAKEALDTCHWDILDAILYLEENKVIKAPTIKNILLQIIH